MLNWVIIKRFSYNNSLLDVNDWLNLKLVQVVNKNKVVNCLFLSQKIEIYFYRKLTVINKISTPVLCNLSPYGKLFSKKPVYSFIKIFGCLCFLLKQIQVISWNPKHIHVCLLVTVHNTWDTDALPPREMLYLQTCFVWWIEVSFY